MKFIETLNAGFSTSKDYIPLKQLFRNQSEVCRFSTSKDYIPLKLKVPYGFTLIRFSTSKDYIPLKPQILKGMPPVEDFACTKAIITRTNPDL